MLLGQLHVVMHVRSGLAHTSQAELLRPHLSHFEGTWKEPKDSFEWITL